MTQEKAQGGVGLEEPFPGVPSAPRGLEAEILHLGPGPTARGPEVRGAGGGGRILRMGGMRVAVAQGWAVSEHHFQ